MRSPTNKRHAPTVWPPQLAASAALPPAVRSFVVLGAEPQAGQTCVTTALLRALGRRGVRAVGMKPVARGIVTAGGAWQSEELQQLVAASALRLPARALCAHLLSADDAAAAPPDHAPTLAAVVDTFRVLATWADTLVVDGAAGAPFGSLALVRGLALPFVFVVSAVPERADAAVSQARALVRSGQECAGWVVVTTVQAAIDAATRATTHEAALRDRMPGVCLGTLVCGAGADTLDMQRTLQALAA
jgi:dethiobiotin synthetase